MKTITLDCAHIQTVKALHIYLQYKLGFPAYYGRNLDALHDLLGEIDGETALVLHTQGAQGEMAAYLPKILRVLEDAAQENPNLTVEADR